jgi:hypothetical protein
VYFTLDIKDGRFAVYARQLGENRARHVGIRWRRGRRAKQTNDIREQLQDDLLLEAAGARRVAVREEEGQAQHDQAGDEKLAKKTHLALLIEERAGWGGGIYARKFTSVD